VKECVAEVKIVPKQRRALHAYLHDAPTIEDAREFLMTAYQDLSSEGVALLSTSLNLRFE
jgi:hypothetical protein